MKQLRKDTKLDVSLLVGTEHLAQDIQLCKIEELWNVEKKGENYDWDDVGEEDEEVTFLDYSCLIGVWTANSIVTLYGDGNSEENTGGDCNMADAITK